MVFRRIFGGKYVLLCLNSPCRENPENVMKKSACFLLIRPLAGYRSPGNREIAIRDQLLVDGSGLPVSFVNNDCELDNILRGMATTTDGRARSLKKLVPSCMFHLSESTDQSGRRL